MNSRQRFQRTMRYGDPDRVPYFEEGLRDDVLECWHKQGLPPNADLARMFHADRRERITVDLEPHPRLKNWPISRQGLETLRSCLDPDDPERFPKDWAARVEAWRTRDHVLELQVHRGLFLSMGVHGWERFLEVIYQLNDAPLLVRAIMDLYGDLAARLTERVLKDVEVDYVTFSEPIGGNDGPLLSPRIYEELVPASYRPVLDEVRRHGVETIVLVTYANARALVPGILKAGLNCLWACETNAEAMDYRALRREFGRDLRLIGGLDLDVLARGREAIRREIEQKVPPLLSQGGYVPLADGRVRANVPYESYAYYRRLLEKVTQA